ncbi:eotaxin-like [Hemiscyllium ocellatum]|uniref:eotaxin-like n=1 Tax=Hemiscyllium ocellatum TaxID=170820 RepID=UPI00296712A0|nr:eotaxin-like [Hemiscyllium ocellatum]
MILGFITLTTGSFRRPGRIPVNCCKSVSSKKGSFTITSYRIQPRSKPCVKAVIFYTKQKGAICANPKAKWVQKMIKQLKSVAHQCVSSPTIEEK